MEHETAKKKNTGVKKKKKVRNQKPPQKIKINEKPYPNSKNGFRNTFYGTAGGVKKNSVVKRLKLAT